ncbi:MAG: hypothetical protein NVS1B4_02440 [Gemmatimonadaceae bacterium]
MHTLAISLQALVAASIFFVWVVRYDNVKQEFKYFGLPDWMRDLVGIAKLTLSLMLLIGIDREPFALIGSIGVALLMASAVATHLRVKNPFAKLLPSLTLFVLSMVIAFLNSRPLNR